MGGYKPYFGRRDGGPKSLGRRIREQSRIKDESKVSYLTNQVGVHWEVERLKRRQV